MKQNHKIAIAVVALIIISFTAGYVSNNDRYDVVNKQDELSVLYDEAEVLLNKDIAQFDELQAKAGVLITMQDDDLENLVIITANLTQTLEETKVLEKAIIIRRIFLSNLKFTYDTLQEMR